MAALAGPLIGAAGSLLGGIFGGSSAKKAGQYLNQTGINVAHSLEKATQGAIDAGYAGLGQANMALQTGLGGATTAYDQARSAIANNAAWANQGIQQGVAGANQAIQGGVTGANQAIQQGVTGANQTLGDYLQKATGYLSPYMQAGAQGLSQLQAFMGPGGAGTTPFNASMMEAQDPGYQFRLQQGAQALERSAAATGGVLGSAQQKALDRYSQDYASNEYQNAFNRYMAGNQQQYNMLSGLANYGQGAAGQAAGLTTNVGGAAAGNIYGGALQGGQNIYGGGLAGGQNIYGGGLAGGQNTMNAGLAQGNMWGNQAGANLTVGEQLANAAMQGNQYIGNIGLYGAGQAGNAYMQGAQGMAGGLLSQANMLGQGIGGAASQIGGGMLGNYWLTGSPWGARSVGSGPTSIFNGPAPGYDPTLGMGEVG